MNSASNYKASIDELWMWIQNTDRMLGAGTAPFFHCAIVQNIHNQLLYLSNAAKTEYPFYSKVLPRIAHNLFQMGINGVYQLNLAAFGELYVIAEHLKQEPINVAFWDEIHPLIQNVSRELYSDGYFGEAAEKAIKEVEQRLRNIFNELKPTAIEPKNVADIVNALLSENGVYRVSANKTPSEKSFSRGMRLLFEGFFAAHRNPSFHGNKDILKHQAVEQIVLSSQLMYILDLGSVA